MDHFEVIYSSKASEYHRMIAVEDVDDNLLKALEKITPFSSKSIIDLGSGTGRFPLILRKRHPDIVALDLNRAMLLEQRAQQLALKSAWALVQGDMRCLPFPSAKADIVMAGWAIGHLRSWFEADWQNQIGKVLLEMERIASRGATLIICETMSTGSLVPVPPNPQLAEFYAWLKGHWGYEEQVIQTDYLFKSVEEAVANTEFFFGSEMADLIRKNGWARLPEWTGIWSKKLG